MAGTWPGSQGGYTVSIPPEEIKQGHIFAPLAEPLSLIDCVTDPSLCLRIDTLATRDIMQLDMTAILRTWPHVGMRYG
jgi:DNA-binding IscR family transcriptional regulator